MSCAIQIGVLSLALQITEVISDWIFGFCCLALTGRGLFKVMCLEVQ